MTAKQTTLLFFVVLIFVIPALIIVFITWASKDEEESLIWRVVSMPFSNPTIFFVLLFFGHKIVSIFARGDWGLNLPVSLDRTPWPFTLSQTFLLFIAASLAFQFIYRPEQFKNMVPLPDHVIDRWRAWCKEKWEFVRSR